MELIENSWTALGTLSVPRKAVCAVSDTYSPQLSESPDSDTGNNLCRNAEHLLTVPPYIKESKAIEVYSENDEFTQKDFRDLTELKNRD